MEAAVWKQKVGFSIFCKQVEFRCSFCLITIYIFWLGMSVVATQNSSYYTNILLGHRDDERYVIYSLSAIIFKSPHFDSSIGIEFELILEQLFHFIVQTILTMI